MKIVTSLTDNYRAGIRIPTGIHELAERRGGNFSVYLITIIIAASRLLFIPKFFETGNKNRAYHARVFFFNGRKYPR